MPSEFPNPDQLASIGIIHGNARLANAALIRLSRAMLQQSDVTQEEREALLNTISASLVLILSNAINLNPSLGTTL